MGTQGQDPVPAQQHWAEGRKKRGRNSCLQHEHTQGEGQNQQGASPVLTLGRDEAEQSQGSPSELLCQWKGHLDLICDYMVDRTDLLTSFVIPFYSGSAIYRIILS